MVALAEVLVGRGEADEALSLLGRVPETAEVRRVAALARLGDGAPLDGEGSLEGRLDGLLGRVKEDDDARREFLDILEAMGPGDPRTVEYRKALTARLF